MIVPLSDGKHAPHESNFNADLRLKLCEEFFGMLKNLQENNLSNSYVGVKFVSKFRY